MRNSNPCPKCRGTDIVRVPGDVRGFGAGNNIMVGRTVFSAIKVTRYLCSSCGYSEEWVDDIADIAAIKKKYGG